MENEEKELSFYSKILIESGEKAFKEIIQKRFNPDYIERMQNESDENYKRRVIKQLGCK